MLVQVECPYCHSIDLIDVSINGYVKWLEGTNIRVALPELTDEQRERLMSGICGPCFPREEEVA